MSNRSVAVGFRSERGAVLLALMLAKALIAIDTTILATAVPSVVRELGAFEQFPWLFSAYLLAQAVCVPIYSKLADTIGRKPIILLGVGLFLFGSVLCALAWNMTALIAFRVVQGLGAGAVAPMSMTIVGDIYSVAERGRVQGYLSSVWAISSVVGPALGGVFAQFGSWRWIFGVNVPLCLVAGWALIRSYQEKVTQVKHRIDYLGAATLTVGLTALILALLQGGNGWAWLSGPSLLTIGIGVLAIALFCLVERRAAEPVLELSLLARRLIRTMALISFGIGALIIGVTSYAPTYLENSIGIAPLVSGAAVAALALGAPLSASISGRLYMKYGFRWTILLGAGVAITGASGLAATGPWPNPVTVAVMCFVIGFGVGWMGAPSLIAGQASVEWSERAVVTGVNVFARTAGSAVGVAIFGAIANNLITHGAGANDYVTIVDASTWVFVAVAITAVLIWLTSLALPTGRVDDPAYTAATAEDDTERSLH
ncbi:MAG: MFS transporter [Propionibacteriaceae bacterium]|jgi:EmrB/QacA subfamily drug resistance transporter|nr:MFS transporter [Propionibacteriaceae bacterium]